MFPAPANRGSNCERPRALRDHQTAERGAPQPDVRLRRVPAGEVLGTGAKLLRVQRLRPEADLRKHGERVAVTRKSYNALQSERNTLKSDSENA